MIILYDVTSVISFESTKSWIEEVNKNKGEKEIIICVVGNKVDMVNEQCVSKNKVIQYCTSINALHFETSAKTHLGVDELFLKLSLSLLEHKHNLSKAKKILEENSKKNSDCAC